MTRSLFSFAMAAAMAALLFAAPAQAKVTVAIGDQRAATFTNPLYTSLGLKKTRYLVPWDAAQNPSQITENDFYMAAARRANQEVLVHFTAKRGCFENGVYSKAKACKAPTKKQYMTAVKTFHQRYPYQKVYGAWNEANHISQPTYSRNGKGKGPKLAGTYYKGMVKALKQAKCKKCTVVAGDLLDSGNLRNYARSMLKYTGKSRKLVWGLHNYADANRGRSKGTTTMLKTVPGKVWLTETGGITIFVGSNLKPTEAKAAKAMKFIFQIAKKYNKRKRGFKSSIDRLYVYDFGPSALGSRFDASLLNPNGTARLTYQEFAKAAKKSKK